MKILRAEYLGMCFGVRDAIELAVHEAAAQPLTILGDLVHNETVLAQLRSRGIQFQNEAAAVATRRVMITAHGASDCKLTDTRNRGLQVIEATCPLVQLAHRSLKALVDEGFHPVIIGQREHVEVLGMTEDLEQYDVVLAEPEIARLPERPRFGVMAQTTQPIDKVRRLAQALRERFPAAEVRFVDTVCQPTKQRQNAAVELAKQSDAVVVIGGKNSNNTHELVKTCAQFCERVFHVQTAADLRRDWFRTDDIIGITAGTSTPDQIITGVEQRLHEFDAAQNSIARTEETMNYAKWIEHFKRNKQNRPEPDWAAPVNIPSVVLAPLLRSVEQFRLGDGGGPASLIAFNREKFRSRTEELRQIVDLWFAEEAEHARLLGCAVRRFGGRIITSHWSFTAFCLCRRVLGVSFELQVLTLTELVSTGYYRMLRKHSPDGPLAAMCELILRDEAGHVAFQRDRLLSAGCPRPGMRGGWWRLQFLFCGYAAGTVLWISHARGLKAIGGTRSEFYSEITRQMTRFIRSLGKQPKPTRVPAQWAQPQSAQLQLAK